MSDMAGPVRDAYAAQVEPRPSRFANEGADYAAWIKRADAWARPRALSGELFAGVAGLGRAVAEVFDTDHGWFCEFDEAPSKVLAHQYPNVPNYGDVTKVDFRAVPHTHVRAGGFPCQDVSLAGRRKGMKDGTRSGLWSEFRRSIQEDRPDWVVIENVRGLLSANAVGDVEPCPWCLGDDADQHALRALGAVLGDLADLGFDAEWTGIRASDVGAPHGRFRVFILAWPRERSTPDTARQRRQVARTSGSAAGSSAVPSVADAPAMTLLPTPAVVMNDGESVESWSARRERIKATGINGNGMGMPLPIAVQLLPTPEAKLAGSGPDYARMNRDGSGGDDLTTTIWKNGLHLLPTPTAAIQTKSTRAMTASRANGRRSGGGQSSPLGLEEATSLIAGVRPEHVPDDADLPPASREIVSALLPTPTTAYATGGNANRGGDRQGEKLLPGLAREHVTDWGPYSAAIARWEQVIGRPAPAPVRFDGKGGKPRLNPELTEWMMGWPAGWVTASVIGLSRAEQLKACGNGVVTLQAVAALREMLARPGVPAVEWGLAA